MIDLELFELKARSVFKETTLRRKLNTLRQFDEFLRKNRLELNEAAIDMYLNKLRKEGKNPGTIRNAYYDIKSYVTAMLLPLNLKPIEEFLPRYSLEEADYLEPEEIVRLLEITNDFYRALYATTYAYARRPGEVLLLRWSDVDFDNEKITFKILKKKDEETATYNLESWIADLLLNLEQKDERVFPITIQRYWKKFKKDCHRAGIHKDVSPHILRHSRITHLAQHGVDIVIIQKYIARHSKLETTVKIYRHVTREEIAEVPTAQSILEKV